MRNWRAATSRKERKFRLANRKSLRKLALTAACLAFAIGLLEAGQSAAAAQEVPAAPVPKQNPGPPPPTQPGQTETQAKIVKNVNLVVLPVTVKDRDGRLVADLVQDDFRVFDDDVEQHIDVFSAEAFPLSIVILLDNDLKSKDAEMVQDSLRAILAGLSAADEASICRFDTYFHPDDGFTHDQDKLLTELKRTRIDESPSQPPSVGTPGGPFNAPSINGGQSPTGGPAIAGSTLAIGEHSTKAIDDAVYGAAQLLAGRGRERRKLILLISDGVNSKFNTNTYENTIQDLLRYGVSVYSVGVGSAVFNRKFTRLQSYANDTGGDIYYAARRSSLEPLYAKVTEQARNTYTLAYIPRGNNRAKEYHTVEVRVKRPDLNIRTRQGYFSGPLPH